MEGVKGLDGWSELYVKQVKREGVQGAIDGSDTPVSPIATLKSYYFTGNSMISK